MSELQESNFNSGTEQRAAANGWQSTWLALAALGMLLIGVASLVKSADHLPQSQVRTEKSPQPAAAIQTKGQLRLTGKSEPAPGRLASIATMQIHPVIKVLIAPGDRVRQGQTIVELDRDEPEADVRAYQAEVVELQASLARLKAVPREQERDKARAELEAARATAKGAREHLARITALLRKEAIAPGQELTARTESLNADADERAAAAFLEYLVKQPIPQEIAQLEAQIASAQAELESNQAELEHYTLHAPIDGVVSWLKVLPGTVTRPGFAAWGEIVDLRELDIRAAVTDKQADLIDREQPVPISLPGRSVERLSGRVVFVGPAADPHTGLVPVLVRVSNPQERLRANVDVELEIALKAAK
ncbi:MAG TPA: efflux RND transporter periplasmic adaptor subunit [Pirellulales bacterium]